MTLAEPGDLVFFGKITSSDAFEQAVIDVVPGNMFHVAIVKDKTTLIHAASDGVVEESLDDVIATQQPHYVEVNTFFCFHFQFFSSAESNCH